MIQPLIFKDMQHIGVGKHYNSETCVELKHTDIHVRLRPESPHSPGMIKAGAALLEDRAFPKHTKLKHVDIGQDVCDMFPA